MSVWRYVNLLVSNKSKFLWRHLLIFSLKLCNFMIFKQKLILIKAFVESQFSHLFSLSSKLCKFISFKPRRIPMTTFVDSQFQVISVYEFQTKANSYGGICWVSGWSYLCLWVSNKRKFLWRYLLSLSLKLYKFTSLKQKQILMKTFVGSQFEVM